MIRAELYSSSPVTQQTMQLFRLKMLAFHARIRLVMPQRQMSKPTIRYDLLRRWRRHGG